VRFPKSRGDAGPRKIQPGKASRPWSGLLKIGLMAFVAGRIGSCPEI